jgi:hypothetical protein
MKRAFIRINGLSHQVQWGNAFALGLARHGWSVESGPEWKASDLLVMWGVRQKMAMHDQARHGGQVCILERGYLGDRFKWTSVSFGGGLNGRAEFRGKLDDASRFARHHAHHLKAWRPFSPLESRRALLIGQVEGDMSVDGKDMRRWYRETTATLEAMGFRVDFRAHPLQNGPKPVRTLAEDLARADVCVTWNSNAAVEAVLAGVPTYALDRGSMAWDVTAHDLTITPFCPPRHFWLAELAWKQWTLDEMAAGDCWAHVGGELVAA